MFYNEDIKKHFLESIDANKALYERMFRRSEKTESFYQKDVYDFVPEEIEDLLLNAKTGNTAYLRMLITYYKRYVDFCIENNYKENGMNYFDTMNRSDDFLVSLLDQDMTDSSFLSPDEVTSMSNEISSYNKKALLFILAEGFSGEKQSELIRMRHQDVNYREKYISLRDDNDQIIGKRYVTYSLLYNLKRAKDELIMKTEEAYNTNNIRIQECFKGDYVIKQVRFKKAVFMKDDKEKTKKELELKEKPLPTQTEPISRFSLYNRIRFYKEVFGKNLNTNDIGFSSIIFFALFIKKFEPQMFEDVYTYHLLYSIREIKKLRYTANFRSRLDLQMSIRDIDEEDIASGYGREIIEANLKNWDHIMFDTEVKTNENDVYFNFKRLLEIYPYREKLQKHLESIQ